MVILMKKILSFALSILVCLYAVSFAFAAEVPAAGEYRIAAALTCYVDAMGGQEFGAGRIKDANVKISADGSATMTLVFQRTFVDIYSIKCYTGVDATNSHPGYYDKDGVLHKDAEYTLSEDTIRLNLAPAGHMESDMISDVHDVSTMTFPVALYDEEVLLYLYINSQIMGVQFCDGSGTNGSANPDLPTPYQAVLTLDWDRMEVISLDEPQQDDIPDKPQPNVLTYLPFDVDLDGAVSAADARLALRVSVGLETLAEITPAFFSADSDGDGQITADDARHILRASVGLEPKAEIQTVIL